MIRRLVAAALMTSALSGAAFAGACPVEPSKVSLNSGATIRVTAQEGDTLSYLQTVEATGQTVEMTVHLGLVTLTAMRDGEGAVFDWKTPLPTATDLVPGATFSLEAMLATPGILPPRPFTAEIEVVGLETVEVAGCSYEALKVIVKNAEAGKPLGETVKWIHLPTLLTLKSEITEKGDTRVQEVTALE